MISALYAAGARRRREWFAARPDARRRLRRPVISIGNIAVGGRGKTPCAALVARLLLEMGERPAILSRGYKRIDRTEGAVVVRDANGIRADVARAGDEPFMLARQLPGTIVVTSADRYLGGRIAEHHLGATVHVLDDGFQHFGLDRDADIVLVAAADLQGTTLPVGRLREPADVLIAADAIVALEPFDPPHEHSAFFRAVRRTAAPVFEEAAPPSTGARVLACAGTADPASFFAALAGLGITIAATRSFPDHHPFTAREAAQLAAEARRSGADAILTTEKDYVRLLRHRPFALPVGYAPLTMEVEPAGAFRAWLASSLAAARDHVVD